MATVNELREWQQVTIPRVVATGWSVDEAKAGLLKVKVLRGLLEAAQAQFVGIVAEDAGRDTKAALARNLKMSPAEASRAAAVADVVGRLPDAAEALADGSVTSDQLHKLAAVRDDEAAAQLLRAGADNDDSPEEFARRVQEYRIKAEGPSLRDQQRASRGVWFSRADHGCIALRAVLPPLEGTQLKSALDDYVNQKYQAKHPDRAKTSGEHGEEPRPRRLADALVDLVTGREQSSQSSGGKSASDPATTGSATSMTNQHTRGRTAVIVTIKAETLEAEVLGEGPIPTLDALNLIGQARVDLYAAIPNTRGEILNFGRNRRLASPLQHLALAVRDGGYCTQPGCSIPWNQCDADHIQAWERRGPTDLINLRHMCTNLHHPHRHETEREGEPSFERSWKHAASPPEAA